MRNSTNQQRQNLVFTSSWLSFNSWTPDLAIKYLTHASPINYVLEWPGLREIQTFAIWEKSHNAQSIIDGDNDNIGVCSDGRSEVWRACSCVISSTMYPYHNRFLSLST